MSKMTFLSNAMRTPFSRELWLQLCAMRFAGPRTAPAFAHDFSDAPRSAR